MRLAIQIPIKYKSSTRVPNKNFRDLNGKPLCYWLLDRIVTELPESWDIFIDSEDPSVFENLSSSHKKRFRFFQRESWFAGDAANGNHLINQFAIYNPDYEVYAQLYVTAVALTARTIYESLTAFFENRDCYDSMFLATEETGWFWYKGQSLNYCHDKANGLPRSQDATVLKETTGLYAISRDAVFRTACRIGQIPLIYNISKAEALDIDTMEDFREAEKLLTPAN